jgi:hypothetical protein
MAAYLVAVDTQCKLFGASIEVISHAWLLRGLPHGCCFARARTNSFTPNFINKNRRDSG